MISFHRSATDSEGPSTGYFPSGCVEYSKTLRVPQDWREKRVSIEFQGVYRDAMVFVNSMYARQRRNGYVPFRVPLDPYLRYGDANTIRVEARSHQDSRWYSGLGIYRDTGSDLKIYLTWCAGHDLDPLHVSRARYAGGYCPAWRASRTRT